MYQLEEHSQMSLEDEDKPFKLKICNKDYLLQAIIFNLI
jgi:hypothetical protein